MGVLAWDARIGVPVSLSAGAFRRGGMCGRERGTQA